MSIDPIQIFVSLMIFVSIFTLVWSLFRYPVPAEPPVHRRMAMALGASKRDTLFEQPVLAPIMSMAMTMARRFSLAAVRDMIRRDLDASGNPNNYSVDESVAISLVSGVGLAMVSSVVCVFLLQEFDLLVFLVMGLIGFGVPIYTLRDAARRRTMRISKQLPYTLDLIALMMEAGSTFSEAIDTIIRDDPDEDFNQELRIVQAEIDLGTNRAAALTNMAERIPLDTLRSIVGAVVQAESLGTPLATILKNQSSMLRMHRSVRAEKLSASASLRILVPSMLILMAVVLVIFGPFIVRWARGEFVF